VEGKAPPKFCAAGGANPRENHPKPKHEEEAKTTREDTNPRHVIACCSRTSHVPLPQPSAHDGCAGVGLLAALLATAVGPRLLRLRFAGWLAVGGLLGGTPTA